MPSEWETHQTTPPYASAATTRTANARRSPGSSGADARERRGHERDERRDPHEDERERQRPGGGEGQEERHERNGEAEHDGGGERERGAVRPGEGAQDERAREHEHAQGRGEEANREPDAVGGQEPRDEQERRGGGREREHPGRRGLQASGQNGPALGATEWATASTGLILGTPARGTDGRRRALLLTIGTKAAQTRAFCAGTLTAQETCRGPASRARVALNR